MRHSDETRVREVLSCFQCARMTINENDGQPKDKKDGRINPRPARYRDKNLRASSLIHRLNVHTTLPLDTAPYDTRLQFTAQASRLSLSLSCKFASAPGQWSLSPYPPPVIQSHRYWLLDPYLCTTVFTLLHPHLLLYCNAPSKFPTNRPISMVNRQTLLLICLLPSTPSPTLVKTSQRVCAGAAAQV